MSAYELLLFYLAGVVYHLVGLFFHFIRAREDDMWAALKYGYWSAFWFIVSPIYLIYQMGKGWK